MRLPGRSVERTITVTNLAAAPLTITEPRSVAAGFTLTQFDEQLPTGNRFVTLNTNDRMSFRLRMDAVTSGDLDGVVSLPIQGATASTFDFFVKGHVDTSRIGDNEDASGFTATKGFHLLTKKEPSSRTWARLSSPAARH